MTGLPIATCAECRRLTKEAQGVELEDSLCPELCESCSDLTLKTWEKHRDKSTSIEQMKIDLARD